MKKPEPKKIDRLDFHECIEFINDKLGYNIDDVEGYNTDPTKEFKCFWHFITDVCEIHNGCEFYMPLPGDYEDDEEPWVTEILEAFLDEFGEGPYYVSW